MIRYRKTILSIALVLFFLGMMMVFYGFWVIQNRVNLTCTEFQEEYPGDCVNSMMGLIQSDDKDFRQKNTAVWVLGQLSDKRALPLLKSLYTGVISKRESIDEGISQYELEKAIKWVEQGNITSWMYR